MYEGHAVEDGDKGQLGEWDQIRPVEIERKEGSKECPKGRTASSGLDSRDKHNPGRLRKHAEKHTAVQSLHWD